MPIPVFIKVGILNRPLTPAVGPARDPQVSGCSCCRPSRGDPSHGTARSVAPGSSRRTRPDRRRGSGGWRDVGRTLAGTRSRSGCPDLGPSRPGERRPSPGLHTREKGNVVVNITANSQGVQWWSDGGTFQKYLYRFLFCEKTELPSYYYRFALGQTCFSFSASTLKST